MPLFFLVSTEVEASIWLKFRYHLIEFLVCLIEFQVK